MIRVHTFLKYARTHLQEAEAALLEDHPAVAIGRCSDVAIALIKAMAAALPRIKKDFLEMDLQIPNTFNALISQMVLGIVFKHCHYSCHFNSPYLFYY